MFSYSLSYFVAYLDFIKPTSHTFPDVPELLFQLIISLHFSPSAPSHPPPTLITVHKEPDSFLFHTVTQRSQRCFGHSTSELPRFTCNLCGLGSEKSNKCCSLSSWIQWRPHMLSCTMLNKSSLREHSVLSHFSSPLGSDTPSLRLVRIFEQSLKYIYTLSTPNWISLFCLFASGCFCCW